MTHSDTNTCFAILNPPLPTASLCTPLGQSVLMQQTVRQPPQWQLDHHPQCATVQGDAIPENSLFDNHIIMRDLFHSRKGIGFPYIYDTTSILMPKLTPPSNLNINRVTCMVLLCHSVYRVIYQAGRLRGDQAYASRPPSR